MTDTPERAASAPPMVPSAEDRFDACLDNGGNCDQFLGIAAIERAYRDGLAAQAAQPPEPLMSRDHREQLGMEYDDNPKPPQPGDAERLAEIDDIIRRTGAKEQSVRSDTGALLLTSIIFLRRLLNAAQSAHAQCHAEIIRLHELSQEGEDGLHITDQKLYKAMEELGESRAAVARLTAILADDLAAARAQGVREGIERAAKCAEQFKEPRILAMWGRPGGPPGNGYVSLTGEHIAAAIRALAAPEPQE